jgi:hypothetical protein
MNQFFSFPKIDYGILFDRKPASLRPYLSSLTSIDPAAMIMFLSDGQQLREDNLRELSGMFNLATPHPFQFGVFPHHTLSQPYVLSLTLFFQNRGSGPDNICL